jgi:hypothetical protein
MANRIHAAELCGPSLPKGKQHEDAQGTKVCLHKISAGKLVTKVYRLIVLS